MGSDRFTLMWTGLEQMIQMIHGSFKCTHVVECFSQRNEHLSKRKIGFRCLILKSLTVVMQPHQRELGSSGGHAVNSWTRVMLVKVEFTLFYFRSSNALKLPSIYFGL
ncbi:hypothetical protein PoB_001226200 [Plakobranchus ocellatus]|uniref:Uncharacterized protein n=1 Tax=Plakobranchus ocellatus TaxID=259542 RepID=A0AAV3YS45_9GAST|nr:hypothetical protein PoB_001226200 [Plakobranchus ocellatus]